MRRQSQGHNRLGIALAIGFILLLGSCTSKGGATKGSDTGTAPLTVAVFNPFSGPDASFGSEQSAGCITATSAITSAGGILNHKQIVVKTSDTRGDPADAVPAAQQLISSTPNLVQVCGPSSDEASATVPLLDKANIPMFADTGQAFFDKSNYQYFHRITPPDDAVGYAMALYAWDHGYKTAAAVFGNDISSQGTAPTVMAGFKNLGGKIVLSQTLALDQSSYRTEVEQLAAAHPDVIFTEADPQTSATYIAELNQLYHLVPIVGDNGTNQPPWIKAVTGAIGASNLNKYFVAAQPYAPATGASYDQWLRAVKAAQSKLTQPGSQWFADTYSMAAYDGVNISALAMEEAKSTDPTVFNPFILRVVSPSPGAVQVHSFAEGKQALLAGKTIQYVGAIGQIAFDQYNNSPGLFEIVKADRSKVAVYTAAQVDTAK